jgi:hypothetical protein
MDPNEHVKQLLDKLDAQEGATSEAATSDRLRQFRSDLEKQGLDEPLILQAESMAFGFAENYPDETTGWGTYYGPMMVMKDENGQWKEAPSIQLVTPEMIEYWARRSEEARNPLFRARYADLVWDFSKKITGTSADVKYAQIVIDQTIQIAEGRYCEHETAVEAKLKRALGLSLAINDHQRLKRIIQTIIHYEDRIGEDSKPGLWGFSFDLLVGNKKIVLAEGDLKKIIDDLENRLERLSSEREDSLGDPFPVEAAAMRLVSFYKAKFDIENVKRVLRKYSQAFVSASKYASPMVAASWLEKVHAVLDSNGLREEADTIAVRIKEAREKSKQEMHSFSYTMELPKEEVEQYVASMTDGTAKETLDRIALQFLPRKDKLEQQVKDLAQKAPLQGLISISIHDEGGRTVATVGSVEDDLEGRVIHQLSQNLGFEGQFLYWVLDRAVSRHKLGIPEFVNHLYLSLAYDPERRTLIERGIKAHIQRDYVTSCCILVPELEAALRRLLHLAGGSIYRPNRSGGIRERTLEEIMRDPIIEKMLGADVITYFRALLTDQRGWNVRNNVCHGLLNPNSFGVAVSNRLVHCLLLLSLIREKDPDDPGKQQQ